jgi:tetratricopeptide (TPR) repeat protein
MTDWYRRTSWTVEDQEEFFRKLARARSWSRAQYLRIQAVHFVYSEDPALLDVAEMLILKLFEEYSENRMERSPALALLGDIYKLRKEFEKAMVYYKKAIDFEKEFPNVLTNVYLEYAELVVKLKRYPNFDFVANLVQERVENSPFPIEKYKAFSIMAIIYSHKGDKEKADHFATLANKNASAETSGLRYHQFLGVVKDRDDHLDDLVKGKFKTSE